MNRLLRAFALGSILLSAETRPEGAWPCRRAEYVMGTMLTLELEAPDSASGRRALDSAFAVAHRLDRLLSAYLPESEISQIAAQAPTPVPVAAETFDFLARTLGWSARSDGALNPAVGPLVEAWGFHTETPSRPDSAVVARLVRNCDYRAIRMDPSSCRVSAEIGMMLDPGATGKGYALAQIDSVLAGMGIITLRADFGGQLYCRGGDSLLVPVRHPRSDTATVAWLRLNQGSVATSGDYERYFEEGGVRYAHIIDPRTGFPVQGRAAVTVFAPDPFDADALSTALFVRGPRDAAPLLARAGAGALFAEWVGDSLALIIVGAWPEAP